MIANSTYYVEGRTGTWSIHANGGSEGTPTLTLTGLDAGALIRVEVNFCAQGSFYFGLERRGPVDLWEPSLPTGGVIVVNGWQTVSRNVYYRQYHTGDCAFFATFSPGDLSGIGKLNNFVISAEFDYRSASSP